MSDWLTIILPLVISVIIPSVTGYITYITVRAQIKAAAKAAQEQIEANRPVQDSDVAKKQQDVYEALYNTLNKEIKRLTESHALEISEIRTDYRAKIASLEKEVIRQGNNLIGYEKEINSLKAVISQTYSDEIRARDAAIRELQGKVAELSKRM